MSTLWNDDADMSALTMMPMGEPTWESMLALPDDTEVAAIFVAPFGIAMRAIHYIQNEHNRTRIAGLRDSGTASLPAYCVYVLPKMEVPDIEDFLRTEESRKDADTNE